MVMHSRKFPRRMEVSRLCTVSWTPDVERLIIWSNMKDRPNYCRLEKEWGTRPRSVLTSVENLGAFNVVSHLWDYFERVRAVNYINSRLAALVSSQFWRILSTRSSCGINRNRAPAWQAAHGRLSRRQLSRTSQRSGGCTWNVAQVASKVISHPV
jgi:hypothetical protein